MPRPASHSACVVSRTIRKPDAWAACSSCSRTTSAVMSWLPGSPQRVLAATVSAVGPQPSVTASQHLVDVDDVVEHRDDPARQCAGAFVDPGLDTARYREAGTDRHHARADDALQRERIGIGGRDEHLAELGTVRRDAHFLPPRAVPVGDPETEVVEQLVGEHDAAGRQLREVGDRREHRARAAAQGRAPRRRRGGRTARAPRRPARAGGARAAARATPATVRRARNAGPASSPARRAGSRARTGPSRHRLRRRGTDRARRASRHHPSSAARDARAEQRSDLGRGDEVPSAAAGAVPAAEEPVSTS